MSLPSRSIVINIGPNEYPITYPNVGKQLDIDLLKLQMSNNTYDQLRYSFNPSFVKKADQLDAVATFNILIPKLKKDITVTSLLNLESEQFEQVLSAYIDQFLPWYEEWNLALSKPKEEVVEEDKK